jgi:hypothetical protein
MGVEEWPPGENKPDGLAFIISFWPTENLRGFCPTKSTDPGRADRQVTP